MSEVVSVSVLQSALKNPSSSTGAAEVVAPHVHTPGGTKSCGGPVFFRLCVNLPI
jgi:hypothetical protein